ncbi:hypothetical protein D3C76_1745470 [compost metagenome]
MAVERKQYYKEHHLIRSNKDADGECTLHAVLYNKLMRSCLCTLDEIDESSANPYVGTPEGKSLHTNSLF